VRVTGADAAAIISIIATSVSISEHHHYLIFSMAYTNNALLVMLMVTQEHIALLLLLLLLLPASFRTELFITSHVMPATKPPIEGCAQEQRKRETKMETSKRL